MSTHSQMLKTRRNKRRSIKILAAKVKQAKREQKQKAKGAAKQKPAA
jgi:hypothetical protein